MKEINFIPSYAVKEQPKPNANIYDLLDKFSVFKDKTESELSHDEWLDKEALNDVYKTLGGNNDFLNLFENLESIHLISKGDKLFAVCLLSNLNIIGLELKEIMLMIEKKTINLEVARKEIELAGFAQATKGTLMAIINSMNDYWHDLQLREK